MATAEEAPKNLGELIDQIDRIREELHTFQRSLEKLESPPKRTRDKNSK
jgi:hypothetical protein